MGIGHWRNCKRRLPPEDRSTLLEEGNEMAMEKAPQMMFDQILTLARDNDAVSIRELCRLGCPPSHANRVGQTALHIGGIWGSIEAVQVLLECKANPNAANSLRGSTPLHAAAMGKGPADKRADCVKLLLDAKADLKQADLGGELPIDCADDEKLRLALGAAPLIVHKAVQAKSSSGLANAVQEVKSGRVNLSLDVGNPQGESALHAAVLLGWREGVELLLQAGASVNTQSNMQQSPLHAAVISGNHRMTELLVKAKADANVQDRDPEYDPRFDSTTFKQDPWKNRAPLHYAADLGNLLAARLLLEAAADPNIRDTQQQTPLHVCIAGLRSEDAKLDQGSGVRVNGLQKRPDWNDCLGSIIGSQAEGTGAAGYPGGAGEGRWPVLLESDASPASEGVLLKESNLKRLGDEMIDFLLTARADVSLGNQILGETRTVLHEAARLGDAVLLQKVVSAKADVNAKDSKLGFSPLHLAARSKHHDAVRLLVEAQADILQVTSGGKTAAELAETNGATPATLAILRGSEAPASGSPATESEAPKDEAPQTLESLTAEQRAMLFID